MIMNATHTHTLMCPFKTEEYNKETSYMSEIQQNLVNHKFLNSKAETRTQCD